MFRPTHYPKRVLAFHGSGVEGFAPSLLAPCRLLRIKPASIRWVMAHDTAAIIQGVCTALCLGMASLPMARYTNGCPGYNLTGYSCYALACIYSGLMAMFHPSPRTSWQCFVVAHAYLTCCRIAIKIFENQLKWKGGSSYSVRGDISGIRCTSHDCLRAKRFGCKRSIFCSRTCTSVLWYRALLPCLPRKGEA